VKVLIVDDEKPARDRLRQLLEDSGAHEVIGEAANGEAAIALSTSLGPDIVLLDIRMPGIDGIETAHHLNVLENPPAVVFTTAYDEYAIDAFEARAIGYVLKPVRRERLERALEHASRLTGQALSDFAGDARIENRRNYVCARMQGELRLIPVAAISYFNADQKYVCVHHTSGEDLIDDSLKSLEQEFAEQFVRIHRGALVAVEKIEMLEKTADGKYRVVLRGGRQEDDNAPDDELLVSRRHLATVRRRLKGE
jgi:two-component system response regulator AlgR